MLEEVRPRASPVRRPLDLAAETIALTDAEIRERMSGNICRCSAYPQILEAIRDVAGGRCRGMRPFTYERAQSPAGAAKAAAETPGAQFLAGGTNLLDLMKLEIERPAHLIDVGRLPLAEIEQTADGGLAHRRHGHQQRPSPPTARAHALSGADPGAARRRLAAAAQQGDRRRQPDAAHPLRLLLRHRQALQQTRARAPAARASAA